MKVFVGCYDSSPRPLLVCSNEEIWLMWVTGAPMSFLGKRWGKVGKGVESNAAKYGVKLKRMTFGLEVGLEKGRN